MYGKLLVVMGMGIPIAQFITHEIPSSFYNVSEVELDRCIDGDEYKSNWNLLVGQNSAVRGIFHNLNGEFQV